MAKRKRGGFSFLDTKRPIVQESKKVVYTKTANAPAVRFIENKAESLNIHDYQDSAEACINQICDLKKIRISQIYKGPYLHRYFYVYLYLEKDKIEEVLNALAIKFQRSIENKSIIITYIHNAVTRVLVAPPRPKEPSRSIDQLKVSRQEMADKKKKNLSVVDKEKKVKPVVQSPGKKIRIDINIDDIDDFLDYLEKRVPERNRRERYVEKIKDLHSNGWNKYRHSTFIDDNKYKVSAKDIEVFVNGMKSRDFNVSVKEYKDALELYLSYRWAKEYSKPMNDDKEDAIPPLVKERKKKETESPSQETQEGKKIFVNISHLESWESSKKESASEPKEGQGVVYIGDPTGKRRSVTLQNASITESDQSVDIKIEMTNQQEDKEVVNEESPITDVPILPVEEEIKEPEEQNQEESVKPSPKYDETKEEDSKTKEKTTAKKKMGWFASIMLRFWTWFYKVRDNSHKES